MKTFALTCVLLLSLSLCFTSCKKGNEADPENPLVGTWTELDLTAASRSISFTKDKVFNLSIGYSNGGGTLISGTYNLEGDRLKTKSLEMREQQPGMNVVKSAANGEIYENATFSISGDILTLKYTTYPADAPVSTTARFKKGVIID